ncbi:MAG: hypothetical protein HFH07_13165, partial [Dorea sp.]|nr:hypothetical protein [Dorea sp.]
KASRPSVLAKLNQFKELVKNAVVDRTKRKELERLFLKYLQTFTNTF